MYNEKLLLGMLEIAISAMTENELCSYCDFAGTSNCYTGCGEDVCHHGLFEGLKKLEMRTDRCA